MPVSRMIDLFAVLLVAVVVLLPPPSIEAHPAIQADKSDLDQLSRLEDALHREPTSVTAAVELSRAYLGVEHPEWALATLAPFQGRGDHRVHQVAAYCHATRLDPQRALAEAEAGLVACDREGALCPEAARIRLSYLAELMRKPAAAGVDPKKDPLTARRMVLEALRATKAAAPAQPPAK